MISTQHRVRIPIACPHKSAMNENSSLNASDYTEESWKVFADALQKAQAVLQDESATEQQVQDALAALNSARAGLKLADDSTDGNADGSNDGSWNPRLRAIFVQGPFSISSV